MTYGKAQFIAYHIYTGAAPDADGNAARYVGPKDPVSDFRQRLDLMIEAIHAAGNSPDIDNDPSVLKVFVAPELYFHPRTGAYPDKGYLGAMGAEPHRGTIMGALSLEVQGPRWKDWLFVFGTAMVEDRMSGDPRKQPGEIAMLNVALVYKGGRSLVVQKKWLSPVDWMDLPDVSPRSDAVKGFEPPMPHYFEGAFPLPHGEEFNDRTLPSKGIDRGGVFTQDGIIFGIEICVDHALQRLRTAVRETGDAYVQVQVVPACGTWIIPARVATLKGGLVFGVDGGSKTMPFAPDKPEDGYHSALYTVTSDDSKPPLAKGSTPTLAPLPVMATVRVNTDLAKVQEVFWLPPDNNPDNPKASLPESAIYQPASIPPAVRT